MNEHDLIDRLADRAAGIDVTAPPVDAMRHRARATRRGRRAAVAATVVVAGLAGGLLVRAGHHDVVREMPYVTEVPAEVVPAPGYRLVGLDGIAVEVPVGWGTNELYCRSAPTRDTVILAPGAVFSCLRPYPPDVESVELSTPGENPVGPAWTQVEIDGQAAYRGPGAHLEAFAQNPATYSASLFFPDADVLVKASGSTSAERVAALLDGVHVLGAQVAVPTFVDNEETPIGAYRQSLSAAGLHVTVVTSHPSRRAHAVIRVVPAPGTVLEPGSTVTVTITGTRRAAAPR